MLKILFNLLFTNKILINATAKDTTYIPFHYTKSFRSNEEILSEHLYHPLPYGSRSEQLFLEAIKFPINTTMIEHLADGLYIPAVQLLGEFYYYGIYPYQQNFTSAYSFFKKAYLAGFPEAYNFLSQMYRFGFAPHGSDIEKALLYQHYGCNSGSVSLCLSLYSSSFPFYAPNSNLISSPSQSFYLLYNSIRSIINPKTLPKIIDEHFELSDNPKSSSFKRKDPVFISSSITISSTDFQEAFQDLITTKNSQKAQNFIRSHSNSPESLFLQGQMEFYGIGVKQDVEKALNHTKLAFLISPSGVYCFSIGHMYFVLGDIANAKIYFNKAIDLNVACETDYILHIFNHTNPTLDDLSFLEKGIDHGDIPSRKIKILQMQKGTYGNPNSLNISTAFAEILEHGEWAILNRFAEDRYLAGDFKAALLMYMEMAQMGLPTASYNAGKMILKWNHYCKDEETPFGLKPDFIYRIAKKFLEFQIENPKLKDHLALYVLACQRIHKKNSLVKLFNNPEFSSRFPFKLQYDFWKAYVTMENNISVIIPIIYSMNDTPLKRLYKFFLTLRAIVIGINELTLDPDDFNLFFSDDLTTWWLLVLRFLMRIIIFLISFFLVRLIKMRIELTFSL